MSSTPAIVCIAILGFMAPLAQATPGSEQPAPNALPPLRPFQIFSIDPSFNRLVSPNVKLETITTFPQLRGEGLLWRNGKLQLSELRTGQVIEVTLDGNRRVLAENAGGSMSKDIPTLQGPNGQVNWRDGAVLLCRNAARDIAVMRSDGTIESFISDYEGKRFNSPNDITVGKDGSVWFTDPPLALPGHPWARAADPNAPPSSLIRPMDKQIPFNGVFRFKDGKLTAVVTNMTAPNGLAFSPDGKTLYVNNAQPEMFVRAYAVASDGTLSDGRDLFRIPTEHSYGAGVLDGLKVDRKGNLWMTGPGGIWVLSPHGKLLGRIQLPSRATNLTFGDDYRSLFIVSNPHVYRIRTRVLGLKPPDTPRSR
jgi:gluconolactonase